MTVAQGILGERKILPAGDYVVRVTVGQTSFQKAVTLPEGGTVTVPPEDLARSAAPPADRH
jgi:hypothetical protein